MLYDTAVCKACCRAVAQHCAAGKDAVAANLAVRVLNIGAGTSLLAMMGARYCHNAMTERGEGQLAVHVTAVEMAAALARLSRRAIAENGLAGDVAVVERHMMDLAFILVAAKVASCTTPSPLSTRAFGIRYFAQAWRYSFPKWGQYVMHCFYFTVPIVCGWYVMQ